MAVSLMGTSLKYSPLLFKYGTGISLIQTCPISGSFTCTVNSDVPLRPNFEIQCWLTQDLRSRAKLIRALSILFSPFISPFLQSCALLYSNSALIDSSLCIRLIASPKRCATDSCFIFLLFLSASSGIVSEITNSFISEFSNLSIAGPHNTGCVIAAQISLAPFFLSAAAASARLPAVATISSTNKTS